MRFVTGLSWGMAVLGVSTAIAMAVPRAPRERADRDRVDQVIEVQTPASDLARFTQNGPLTLDARLGHASLRRGRTDETFVFASVAAPAPDVSSRVRSAPLDLAIVIDRSGSMKGERLRNAIAAGLGTLERLRDGDSVTLVTFDTMATVLMSNTTLTPSSRARAESALRSIELGGDTCISCGLEAAMRALAPAVSHRIGRVLLLSDGATNHGIRDLPGLRALAGRMRDRGLSVTTIGVDVDFDERVMAAIAQESNGRHYFVANPSGLPAVFAQEFDMLAASVAQEAELEVELADGVELDQVYDRTFRRDGRRVFIPFGTFAARQEKTVLLRVRLATGELGVTPVVSLRLVYRDLVERREATASGKLALRIVPEGAEPGPLDPVVSARLARSSTSKVLTDANTLFEQGRADEARALLGEQVGALRKASEEARHAPELKAKTPARAERSVEQDLDDQLGVVQEAETAFAAPPPSPSMVRGRADAVGASAGGGVGAVAAAPAAEPASRAVKSALKRNQERALDLGR